jgi:hypothetical protein
MRFISQESSRMDESSTSVPPVWVWTARCRLHSVAFVFYFRVTLWRVTAQAAAVGFCDTLLLDCDVGL